MGDKLLACVRQEEAAYLDRIAQLTQLTNSAITVADTNEEGANLLALQTRQQLASTSLSFASQADQTVLSLF